MKTVLINGSPKKKYSVTGYFLDITRIFIQGDVVAECVRNHSDHQRVLKEIEDADAVVFGLPLYVDGVPSHMLSFMEEMEWFCKGNSHPLKVYVLSNSGFIEGKQNRPLMMVFENFCERSCLNWCGGIGIGGGVMLNVLRILFLVYLGLFFVNLIGGGLDSAVPIFMEQAVTIFLLSIGAFFYCFKLGAAVNKGECIGLRFTRVLLPAIVFILGADLFFLLVSAFRGGLFRGWLRKGKIDG